MGRRKRARKNTKRETPSSPPAGSGKRVWLVCGAILIAVAAAALLFREPPSTTVTSSGTASSPTDSEPPATLPPQTRGAQEMPGATATRRLQEVGQDRTHATSWQQVDDPARDGWQTEAIHLAVKKQLKKLGQAIVATETDRADKIGKLIASDFSCDGLVPTNRTTVVKTPLLTVERRDRSATEVAQTPHAGAAGLISAINDAFAFLRDAQDARFKFKVTRVNPAGGGAEQARQDAVQTRQRFSLSARTPTGMIEQHATWLAKWQLASSEAAPLLSSISVDDFEQTTSHHPAGPLMSDCTEAALGANDSYEKQIARGANHWLERIPFRTMLNLFSMPGLAVGDVNGDGLEDVYLCQDPGLPNRLFLQQTDGTLRDVSEAWQVDWIEDARCALLVDLDNDGDQDLVVAIRAAVVIASNEANRSFQLRTILPTSEDTTSICAFDYDSDGRLDIYVCAYQPNELLKTTSGASMGAAMPQFVLHDANNAAANMLFRNTSAVDRAFRFQDVTESAGLDVNNRRWSLAASAEDFDNDGDLDLYVANDYGRDNLYRNDAAADGARTFVDVGDAAHIVSSAAGMAIAWGDYDRDGWMDAYVSNMWSSAGHRITFQPQFKADASDEVRRRLQFFASGNTLLRNRGDGSFTNRTEAAGVAMGRWAWGNSFLDLDNDGWQDLIVANGYMTTDDSGDL